MYERLPLYKFGTNFEFVTKHGINFLSKGSDGDSIIEISSPDVFKKRSGSISRNDEFYKM